MPKEDIIFKDSKITYKGIFDLELLYRNIRDWFFRIKYADPKEIKYVERIKPGGKTIEFILETNRGEESGYFKLNQKVEFFINGMQDVEIEQDGKKIKVNNGEIEIKFSSSIIRNDNKLWHDENSILFKFYERFIIQDKIETFKIDTYKDTTKLIDEFKSFLNLYKFD